MKGDHRQADDERGRKLLDSLYYGTKFQDGLRKIRHDFNIPENGFSNGKQIRCHYGKLLVGFLQAISDFLLEQRLPDNEWWRREIIECVFSEKRIQFLPRTALPVSPFIGIIKRSNPRLSLKGGSYVDVRFYEGVSQRDIINFVKHYGALTKPAALLGTKQRIRKIFNEGRYKKILNNWSKSKEELGAMPGEKVTKEILISRKVGTSPENVSRINYRKRKSKR